MFLANFSVHLTLSPSPLPWEGNWLGAHPMEAMANFLFSTYAIALASLLVANVAVTILLLNDRKKEAAFIRRRLAPVVSYFRLGGKSQADSSCEKHA